MSFFRLSGEALNVSGLPLQCARCGCKDLFQQPDYKKSVGVGLLAFGSILTYVFLYMGFNWWLTWSPMLVLLILDRVMDRISPRAVICYDCELIHRSFSRQSVADMNGFDLLVHDRYLYVEREAAQKNP